jgi:hypothetical protein
MILLVTGRDDTHRKPLLESQGYEVVITPIEEVTGILLCRRFALALISTDGGVDATLDCCEKMKTVAPGIRIAVIAERAEYVPPNTAVDAIIRQQHSPGRFLAAVARLLDVSPLGQSYSAKDGK